MRGWWVTLLAWGCGGDDEPTTTDPDAGTCNELDKAPMSQVPATEWDPGLGDAFDDFELLAGRWNVSNECGGIVGIKITTPDRESMDIVTSTWTTPSLFCGCVNDPEYADDTKYDPIATFDGFEFYIETFDDPGVQGQNIVGSGSLFSGAPFTVRGCAVKDIDPAFGSAWDQMTAIIRIENGEPTGSLVLATNEQQVTTCKLSNWQLVQKL